MGRAPEEAKRCGGLVLLERAFEIRGALGNQWLDSVREVGKPVQVKTGNARKATGVA